MKGKFCVFNSILCLLSGFLFLLLFIIIIIIIIIFLCELLFYDVFIEYKHIENWFIDQNNLFLTSLFIFFIMSVDEIFFIFFSLSSFKTEMRVKAFLCKSMLEFIYHLMIEVFVCFKY